MPQVITKPPALPGASHLKESMKLTATRSYEVYFPGGVAIWLCTVKQPHFTWFSSSFSKHVPGTPRKFQRKYKSDRRRAVGLVLCICVSVTLKMTSVKFYRVATSTGGKLTFLQTETLLFA